MSTESSSNQASGQVGGGLAVGILCLIIGGAIGYYTRFFTEQPQALNPPPPPMSAGSSGEVGAPSMGAGGGGGGGANPGTTLARTVRNLATIQKVQSAGITSDQAKALVPLLEQVKGAEKLSESDAQAKLDAITKALTTEQKAALEAMQPFRRGGGGGPAGGGSPGGPAGGPGGGGPMVGSMSAPSGGGGGMGGGGQDPERPFASERNKQALDDLISRLKQ